MGRHDAASSLVRRELALIRIRGVFVLGTADCLGDRLEQLGIFLTCVALLLGVHVLVGGLQRRLAEQAYHVVVRQLVLPWPRTLRRRAVESWHVARSLLCLDRKYRTILQVRLRAERDVAFVPALLRLVKLEVVGSRARLERSLPCELPVMEPVLCFPHLPIFHDIGLFRK